METVSNFDTARMPLLRPALLMLLLLSLLTGLAYPLLVTGVAQLAFPAQAEGSLLRRADGTVVGSSLIGQATTDPGHFWSRPSATQPGPYNAGSSSGSNLGPLNPALMDAVKVRVAALKASDPTNPLPIPVDLVTASASGLDPHISPAAAAWQLKRVARARGMAPEALQALVARHTEPALLGFIGAPRVNVLLLNLELDRIAPRTMTAR